MDLLLGTGILAASYLLFCWAWLVHRGPRRAPWVELPGTSMMICVVLTTLPPIGLGFLALGLMSPLSAALAGGLVPLIGTLLFSLLAVLAGQSLWRRSRGGAALLPQAANRNVEPTVAAPMRVA